MMKLKNKKTGEVVESFKSGPIDLYFYPNEHESKAMISRMTYKKPAEPLIKDEKIRKAVRAWAEANNFLDEIEVHSLTAGTRFSIGHYDIEFLGYFIYDLESNKTYTIEELCGEEEE